ncbi:MAG: hypothetical protein JO122_18680 [Acetobacteraceae bacterium]|nr:hypothetical protein [Acetobacteraceae bacterium]
MEEDQLFLHPAKPPPAGISDQLYRTIETDFITGRLVRKRRVWQAAILGMVDGATAAVKLIEAFARACN